MDQSSSWVRYLCSQVSSSLSSVWRYVSGAVKIHKKDVIDNIDVMHNQQWLLAIFKNLFIMFQQSIRLRKQVKRVMDPSLLKTSNLHEVKHWIEPGKDN